MLNDICLELNNFFDRDMPKIFDTITINKGRITNADFLAIIKKHQYFRIVGSVFNDGVYRYDEFLQLPTDETFKGAIWLMAVPADFLALVDDIKEWQTKNGGADSVAMSPFASESFGGYSYSKASGGSSSVPTWQSVYASRLNKYRRIRGV